MLALLGARKWLSVGLICAAVVLGACGRGGPGAGSLSSDDVFKVELRTAIRDVNFDPDEEGSEEYFIREWRLDVPQSYIYTYRGTNGEVSGGPDNSNPRTATTFRVWVHGKVDLRSQTLYPSSDPGVDYDLSLRLTNQRIGKKLWPVEGCIRQSEVYQTIGLLDGAAQDTCDLETAKFCPATMSIDGWWVDVFMEKQQYEADPQPMCNVAAKFLDEHTIVRESVDRDTARGQQ
tara:strand:+ start:21864 stop:22562 length:699 start_codon:yes stop_codon:yes gene_type:complete